MCIFLNISDIINDIINWIGDIKKSTFGIIISVIIYTW